MQLYSGTSAQFIKDTSFRAGSCVCRKQYSKRLRADRFEVRDVL
jgi:hypothetical protein